jgi:hypothetical protein
VSRIHRAAIAVAIAVATFAGSALGGGASTALAATPDLTLVTTTTYDVLPDKALVHVTSAITATNHLKDTVTQQFFFQTAYLSVQPGTSGFKLTSPGLKPSVAVAARKPTYTLLKLNFGKKLAARKSLKLTLTFDEKDPGGAPERAFRVSPSIVAFTAWAFATPSTSGSSVNVRFPAGYTVTVGRGPLSGPTIDPTGGLVWASGPLASPLAFIADLTADRPGDYTHTSLTATIGGVATSIDLRSWPDDTAWRGRVGDLLVRGLPVLASEIGVPWPIDGQLVVQEALIRSTGGYAGVFDPANKTLLVSYAASSGVVLHEAAHVWFNGRLVADRWAAEAFASYYASVAATELGVPTTDPQLTDAVRAAAFPLNAWGPIGSNTDAAEAYGYAGSLAFAEQVAARAGPEGLRAVWAKAATGAGAYQPPNGVPEPTAQVPDWRGLLDLFDDATGKDFTDLWRQWVGRPEDDALLGQRSAARVAYAKAVADANPWQLPRSIRDALRAWQFDRANDQMADAEGVLAQRTQLTALAADVGVALPPTVQQAFEGADTLPAAAAEATAEQATLESIKEAAAANPAQASGAPPALVAVGMVGTDPAGELATSKTAFTKGDLNTAIAAASAAAADWSSAADRGRGRLISLGLLVVALLLLWRMTMLHRWRPRNESTPA